MNLLLCCLFWLIPFVGPLVVLGYKITVFENFLRQGDASYPDFDMNRFGDYLMRGVWQLLAGLLLGLVCIPLCFVAVLPIFIGIWIENFYIMVLASLSSMLVIFAIAITLALAATPVVLQVALTQDVTSAFNFSFIKDFIARTWKEMLLSTLFCMFANMILSLIGALACGIGLLPAAVVALSASWHINYQLYAIYLERGGMQIPIKATL